MMEHMVTLMHANSRVLRLVHAEQSTFFQMRTFFDAAVVFKPSNYKAFNTKRGVSNEHIVTLLTLSVLFLQVQGTL